MKALLFGFFFFACTVSCAAQFIYTGVYTRTIKKGKEIDSLVIRPDSTCRIAFYFPKTSVYEYVEGTWKMKNASLLLFTDKTGKEYASMDMLLDFANNVYRAILISGPAYLEKKTKFEKISGD